VKNLGLGGDATTNMPRMDQGPWNKAESCKVSAGIWEAIIGRKKRVMKDKIKKMSIPQDNEPGDSKYPGIVIKSTSVREKF